jgi:hypothetical protein
LIEVAKREPMICLPDEYDEVAYFFSEITKLKSNKAEEEVNGAKVVRTSELRKKWTKFCWHMWCSMYRQDSYNPKHPDPRDVFNLRTDKPDYMKASEWIYDHYRECVEVYANCMMKYVFQTFSSISDGTYSLQMFAVKGTYYIIILYKKL